MFQESRWTVDHKRWYSYLSLGMSSFAACLLAAAPCWNSALGFNDLD